MLILDPIKLRNLPVGAPLPPSYWAATAGPAPTDDGQLTRDIDVDVAIIGGGYTGLSCAHHLAKSYGASVAVLEANRPGWGCSGRNGGCGRSGLGRAPVNSWVSRWGMEGAQAMFREQQAAMRTLHQTIEEGKIDCDKSGNGFLRVAHRPSRFKSLIETQRIYQELFGYKCDLLTADDLARDYVHAGEAFGGLQYNDGFGVHPLKLVHGLLDLARSSGAKVHSDSPVIKLEKMAECMS